MSDELQFDVGAQFGAGVLMDTMPAHWETNYLGVWAIQDDFLRQFVSRFSGVDLPIHIQTSAAEVRAEMERIQGGYDVEVSADGIAIVRLVGTTSKHYNSFARSTSTLMMRKTLRSLRRNRDIRGVVLHIDSPGGAVAGQKAFADEIAALTEEKPTVAFIEDLGCSAAYWSASQAGGIVANDMAIVGSIGTYGVVYDSSKKAEDEGIKVHIIKAGTEKGVGVPGTEITDDHLAKFQEEVDALNEFFIEAVSDGRQMPFNRVAELATGDVWIGEEAIAVGLIDEIGTLDSVVSALRDEIEQVDKAAKLLSRGDGMSEERKDEYESRVAELEASLAESKEMEAAAVAHVVELESTARAQRFEQLIGSGDSAWAGERATHLQMLQMLAADGGEDSDRFAAYVRQQKAITAQLADSTLFREIGNDGDTPSGRSASGQIEAKARTLAETAGISYEQAYTRVITESPALYAEYQKEV